jgi:hypothetical protein
LPPAIFCQPVRLNRSLVSRISCLSPVRGGLRSALLWKVSPSVVSLALHPLPFSPRGAKEARLFFQSQSILGAIHPVSGLGNAVFSNVA